MTWIVEIMEPTGEVVTEAMTASVEIGEQEAPTIFVRPGVSVLSHGRLEGATAGFYRLVLKKVDENLGIEGIGEVIVDRWRSTVSEHKNIMTTLESWQHGHIEEDVLFNVALRASRAE